MDWTEGYVSDVEYIAFFCREQNPGYLNLACVLNGVEPVDLSRPFTYFELGFGRGLTLNILAAGNPQGSFYGADFMPGHVREAQEVAESAQLPNVTLLENSFADLAAGRVPDLPQFDFITLHGVYSWITPENRRHIVDFIGRYLKPGGMVYVSYNALPGWSAAAPLQRLLREHAERHPAPAVQQMREAARFVSKMAAMKAQYFTENEYLLAYRVRTLQERSPHYLAHEYMNRSWHPMYFADVARELSAAKLDFVGSGGLSRAFPDLYATAEEQAMLAELPDPVMRQTCLDFFRNAEFRRDIFIRGARSITPARREAWLRDLGLALVKPRDRIKLEWDLPYGGAFHFDEALYEPMLDALATRPHSLAELACLPALQGKLPAALERAAAILISLGHASLYRADRTSAEPDRAHALNRAIAARARYCDDYQALASPLLGTGVPATYMDRLVYSILSQQPRERGSAAVTRQAWEILQAGDVGLSKKSEIAESDEQKLALLGEQIEAVLANSVPLWRQLQVM